MTRVVLCDLNMGHRPSVTRNIALASRFAEVAGATVIGWAANRKGYGALSKDFKAERIDFQLIAGFYGVDFEVLVPRLKPAHMKLRNLRLLLILLWRALLDPIAFSKVRALNLNLGQMAVDSQRRRTLSLLPRRFPSTYPKAAEYPVLSSNTPTVLRWFTQSIFRYAFDAWYLAIFWTNWISEKQALASFQLHTERLEFQIVTNIMNDRKTPVFCTLEFLSEDYITRRRRLIRKLGSLASRQGREGHHGAITKESSSELRSALDARWTFGQRHDLTREAEPPIVGDLENLDWPDKPAYLVALPATWEAFNHSRANKYLHNFRDWFAAVEEARARRRSPGVEVWIKPHPFEFEKVWPYIRNDITNLASAVFGDEYRVLDRRYRWKDLEFCKDKLCVVTLSSTSIVDASALGFKVIPCEINEYDLWDFATPPTNRQELVERLVDGFERPAASLPTVMSAINYNHLNVWYEKLDWMVLGRGPSLDDLNQRLALGSYAYESSTSGLTLTERSLNKSRSRVEQAVNLIKENMA